MLICLPASITYYYSETKFTGWYSLLFPPSLQLSHFRIRLAAVTAPPKKRGVGGTRPLAHSIHYPNPLFRGCFVNIPSMGYDDPNEPAGTTPYV